MLRWDRAVPAEALAALRFGPKPGQEVALKDVSDGLLTRPSVCRATSAAPAPRPRRD